MLVRCHQRTGCRVSPQARILLRKQYVISQANRGRLITQASDVDISPPLKVSKAKYPG